VNEFIDRTTATDTEFEEALARWEAGQAVDIGQCTTNPDCVCGPVNVGDNAWQHQ
jgi:hypothetical protein